VPLRRIEEQRIRNLVVTGDPRQDLIADFRKRRRQGPELSGEDTPPSPVPARGIPGSNTAWMRGS
jgi:hypothetical protein